MTNAQWWTEDDVERGNAIGAAKRIRALRVVEVKVSSTVEEIFCEEPGK